MHNLKKLSDREKNKEHGTNNTTKYNTTKQNNKKSSSHSDLHLLPTKQMGINMSKNQLIN